MALLILGACLLCATNSACIPAKLPTSEKGTTGLPTSVYDPGTPPPKWEYDPQLLPVYPGARRYESWRSYITPDAFADVIAWYEGQLKGADVTKTGGATPVVIFKTTDWVLEIKTGEGDNTLITFNKPEEP